MDHTEVGARRLGEGVTTYHRKKKTAHYEMLYRDLGGLL